MHVCSLVWSPVFPFSVPLNIDIGKSDTEELTACKQNWPRLLSYLLSLFSVHFICVHQYSMYHNRQCAYVLCFVSLRLCVAVLYRFLAHSAITFLLVRLFFVAVVLCRMRFELKTSVIYVQYEQVKYI